MSQYKLLYLLDSSIITPVAVSHDANDSHTSALGHALW